MIGLYFGPETKIKKFMRMGGESEIVVKEGLKGGLELTPGHCSKQSDNQIGHDSYI